MASVALLSLLVGGVPALVVTMAPRKLIKEE